MIVALRSVQSLFAKYFRSEKKTFSVNTGFLSQYLGKRFRYVNWGKTQTLEYQYHLHGEYGNSCWKIKWLAPFPFGKLQKLMDCDMRRFIFPLFKSFQQIRIYRKIPKMSPGVYIFQRPFLKGLFLEGLIFRGAYLRREICVSKSIGLAL